MERLPREGHTPVHCRLLVLLIGGARVVVEPICEKDLGSVGLRPAAADLVVPARLFGAATFARYIVEPTIIQNVG